MKEKKGIFWFYYFKKRVSNVVYKAVFGDIGAGGFSENYGEIVR